MRLDDLIRTFSVRLPDHVKLDVDGAELSVPKGHATPWRIRASEACR
jgi:hypothetical protein